MEYQKTLLSSGVRLLTVLMKDTKTVTVMVFVGTGSKYEAKEINGISHFLEHMTFKGTERRPSKLALTKELDGVGAEYNAFTGGEATVYYVKADYTHFDMALDIVSDMIFNSKLDETEIAREKGVIKEEINMYKDDPANYISDLLEELLYGDQPAGRSVLGTAETVDSFKRSDLVSYFENHYCSSNMVVCVAGNFDEGEAAEKTKKYFAPVSRRSPEAKFPTTEKQDRPQSLIYFKETEQTHFYLTFRSFINSFDQKRFPEFLLANILGGGMSSRMFITIRDELGLAYYISAGAGIDADTGYLWANAGVDNKRAAAAAAAVIGEFNKMKKYGATEEELQKAKNYYKGHALISLENSDAVARFFGSQEIITGAVLTPEEILKKVDEVSLDQVNALAREILKLENLNLALIGPFKDKEKFDSLLLNACS